MENLPRRLFSQQLLNSLLSFSLVKTLFTSDLLAKPVERIAHQWLIEMELMSKDLKRRKLKQSQWQVMVADLFNRVELPDILRAINFNDLSKKIKLSDEREAILEIAFPSLQDVPKDLTCSTIFEALKKGRAIAPHGHHNMASLHLVLSGEVHLQQYDRVADEATHLIVLPTVDKACGAGELSTISDEKNNIHWFKGISDVTFIFNAGIYGLEPKKRLIGRDYIDPNRGEELGGGRKRVRRLSQSEAFKLYNSV